MALWTSSEIKKITGGAGSDDWTVDGISIDSRTLQKGDLFVALTDKRDGHAFLDKAFENGAAAALVSHIPEGLTGDSRLILVKDVLEALKELAFAARERFSGKLIAVTGSVGKTSTKEMLSIALTAQGIVHASDKSFNNHWGVPLTLARMPKNTEFAIIEMGMNQQGEIRAHSLLSRPHVALITEVKKVHMSNFRKLEEIALAKSEIFSGLEAGGLALVNSDIEHISTIESSLKGLPVTLQKFGMNGPDWILDQLNIKDRSLEVKAIQGSTKFKFELNSLGQHFASNGLAALAAVSLIGADKNVAIKQLQNWLPMQGRGQHIEVNVIKGCSTYCFDLIDDSYNSNPTSLRAGFKLLDSLWDSKKVSNQDKGRKIAILGDMLELGPDEITIHRSIANWDEISGIKKFYLVGELMKNLFEALPSDGNKFWFSSSDELNKIIVEEISMADVILVKGSKNSNMGKVVSKLKSINHLSN
jgi:UDP-N-acetylmuramoyl-tripeptide--D-alanyl-D-alanine ligase